MATNNFYNHENGIYVIETTTFEQMKEWMETDEFFEWARDEDRKSTRLNSSHGEQSRMPSSA